MSWPQVSLKCDVIVNTATTCQIQKYNGSILTNNKSKRKGWWTSCLREEAKKNMQIITFCNFFFLDFTITMGAVNDLDRYVFIRYKTWGITIVSPQENSSCIWFWELNRFSQIGCITARTEIQASQGQTDFSSSVGQQTHLLWEDVYTYLTEDNEIN